MSPKTVVVTVTRSGKTIMFTVHGGTTMDSVSELRCWIGGTAPGNENFTMEARSGATTNRNVIEGMRVVVVRRFVGHVGRGYWLIRYCRALCSSPVRAG
jgi:hypothetical protein